MPYTGGESASASRPAQSRWLTVDGSKVYFNRTARDLKRIDIVEADTAAGTAKVIIAERSNTYIEIQPLRTLKTAGIVVEEAELARLKGERDALLAETNGAIASALARATAAREQHLCRLQ